MRVYFYILKTERFKDTLLHEASLSVSKIKLVGGEKEWEGNIIVGGKPVCDDASEKYGKEVAQVVCRFILFWQKTIIHIFITIFLPRELGYDGGQYTKESHFGQVSDDFMMDDVKCKGTEEKLLDCPHTTEDDCEGIEGLGVICIPNHPTIQGFVYLL